MAIPSHNLLMATVETLNLIEIRDGHQACLQASELMDSLINRQLAALNAAASRRTRNELKHCLRMLLRREARTAGVDLPCLSA